MPEWHRGLLHAGLPVDLLLLACSHVRGACHCLGFFRSVMPLSSAAFLLTLATVDDLGAILVLATVGPSAN